MPVQTVLEFTGAVDQVVVFFAGRAEAVLVLEAAVDCADSPFQWEMGQTLNTGSSVVLEAPSLHFLAVAVISRKEAALAGYTAVIIVDFAVGDHTAIVLKRVGFVAFETAVIGLL